MGSNPPNMTPGADRNDDGKFQDTYPNQWFVNAIRELGGAGTTDIAKHVIEQYDLDKDPDAWYETTYKKLKKLKEKDEITAKRVGRAYYWELPDE